MSAPDPELAAVQALAADRPLPVLRLTPLWHAAVDIGEREPLGVSPHGERWIVPILGGRFWGAPGHEALSGIVRPGGADRQLQLADGSRRRARTQLDTRYVRTSTACRCGRRTCSVPTMIRRFSHSCAPPGAVTWTCDIA